MDLLAIERIIILASSAIAIGSCMVLIGHALRHPDAPRSLRGIEISWTAVSLGLLLAMLAATSFLPLDG
jgi:hypothetical protein